MLPESMFAKSGNCRVVEVDDGFVVSDAQGDEVHFLNKTAAIVYEMCDGQTRAAEIARFLEKSFSLGVSALPDVSACLQTLEDKHLIRKLPNP